jgi:hypothetical protein
MNLHSSGQDRVEPGRRHVPCKGSAERQTLCSQFSAPAQRGKPLPQAGQPIIGPGVQPVNQDSHDCNEARLAHALRTTHQ